MFASGKKGSKYIDRGYVTVFDFDKDDLTFDAAWHTLDLSGIVPKNVVSCVIYIEIRTVEANKLFNIISNVSVDSINMLPVRCKEGGNSDYVIGSITPDKNGIIKYNGVVATWSRLNILIKGWFI